MSIQKPTVEPQGKTGDFERSVSALSNVLEDFVSERSESERTRVAMLNILEDFNAEKEESNKSRLAVMNILEDLTTDKSFLEQARSASINILEDLNIEKAMAEEVEAKDEAMLGSIGDGIIATDNRMRIIFMNKAAEDMLGWRANEVKRKILSDIIPIEDQKEKLIPEEKRPLHIALATTTTAATTTGSTFYYVKKDKTRLPISVTAAPILLEGKIIGAIEVFRDITKEKELDRAKSEFISIASHQLRTPVSGLNWLAEALQFTSKNLDPKQKTYVKNLSILSQRLTELVEDLLDFSRIELKKDVMLEKHQIELVSFLEEFIKEMEHYAASKKHNIILKKEFTGPVTITINKRALYNVLQNLVSNAIDYSPGTTTVTIVLENIGAFIKTSIANQGPAISKEDQPRIFERFYRSESAKKMKAEGTGLGLYIVKAIVEEIGGEVGFESEEGKDTVFWFTIPIKSITNENKTDN